MKAPAVAALAASLTFLPAAARAAGPCEGLVALALPDTAIDAAQPVAAGDYAPAGSPALRDLPAFCRVHGTVAPVPGSRIGFGVWLPQNGGNSGWNGKLLMLGNGGYSSALPHLEMAARLRAGYAALGTDTGHTGDDPDFAVGHPEAIVDWGHRAVHESVVKAKAVVAAFYGEPARRAYFSGCSTGGQQAFMEAQRHPEDFDGILAGAPGHNRTHLNAGFLWQYLRNHAPSDDAAQIVPASKLPAISRAVLAACRADNGTKAGGLPGDEFLNDPLACGFDPAAIRCPAEDGPDCLTAPQVDALRAMYDGARNPRTGERIYFGFPKGSENAGRVLPHPPGWSLYWADPKAPARPARANFWRHWASGDPGWDWWGFDFDRGMAAVDDRLAPVINAMDPDLERFRRRGSKLLHYHGLADPVVPAPDSILYYERVVSRRSGGSVDPGQARQETAGFYRLFLVPGMEHCRGGSGPDSFDALTALERWVEEDVAPDRIVATRFAGEGPERRAALTRPLCPYPRQARYKGAGDPSDAGNFECAADRRPRDLPAIGAEYLR